MLLKKKNHMQSYKTYQRMRIMSSVSIPQKKHKTFNPVGYDYDQESPTREAK